MLLQLPGLTAQFISDCPQMRISIQGGAYVPSFEVYGIQIGGNIGYEMDYSFKNRLMVAFHANYGWSRYIEELPRDAPSGELTTPDGRNADYTTIHIGPMMGYRIVDGENIGLNLFVGASTITETKNYPYVREEYDEHLQQSFYSTDYKYYTITDIAFPIKCELDFAPEKNFSVSLVGGFYFHPEEPLTGLHLGPQLNWRF